MTAPDWLTSFLATHTIVQIAWAMFLFAVGVGFALFVMVYPWAERARHRRHRRRHP